MKAFLHTAAGNPENQDRGAIIKCGNRTVLVIADGAGGTSGGREAAVLAIELVESHAPFLKDAETCLRLLKELDASVARDKIAGETTCVIAVVANDTVFGASIGDSGARVIRQNDFVDLTSRQVRKPLAGSGSAFPVAFHHRIGHGEFLVLATDGLFKYAGGDQIAGICHISPFDTVPAKLIELVRYPSGALPDDVTVIFAGL